MKHPILWTFILTMAAVSIRAADEPSFNGTWKLNLEKSKFSGQTTTIEKTATGLFHFDSEGFGYDFDLTGKQYPTPDGGTTAWWQASPTEWQCTNRMHGKVMGTYDILVDGDSMNCKVMLVKPDGSTVEQDLASQRISGGPGVLGKWRTSGMKGAATSLEITIDGASITLKYPEWQIAGKGNFDGKDYTMKEGNRTSKFSWAFEKTAPDTIKLTTKLQGKPYYTDLFVISSDGKTLTDNGNSVAVDEPVKSVYEKP